ncbi:unnamed protein product [Anisakis simplex]|uniref:Uncharacterized protein n=1 Tax=Anisakis simplex TaxID=6269 RepID=A0A0M3KHK6_ANISI|nr:unnamed protein product [Anisakis simplex]
MASIHSPNQATTAAAISAITENSMIASKTRRRLMGSDELIARPVPTITMSSIPTILPPSIFHPASHHHHHPHSYALLGAPTAATVAGCVASVGETPGCTTVITSGGQSTVVPAGALTVLQQQQQQQQQQHHHQSTQLAFPVSVSSMGHNSDH